MSKLQKRLKAYSIGIMGFGLLDILAGVFMMVASPFAAGLTFTIAGDPADGSDAAVILGAVGAVIGLYCIVVGVLGARVANNPRKLGAFKWLDLLLVVTVFVEFCTGLLNGGQISWVEPALFVLGVLAYVNAVKANEEALDR
ncbi:hypothetical protein [Thermophilibacter sp.]